MVGLCGACSAHLILHIVRSFDYRSTGKYSNTFTNFLEYADPTNMGSHSKCCQARECLQVPGYQDAGCAAPFFERLTCHDIVYVDVRSRIYLVSSSVRFTSMLDEDIMNMEAIQTTMQYMNCDQ